MGWKASTIIINKPSPVDHLLLLKALGLENLEKIEDEPFEVAMNPRDNRVYIGSYKNNLLVCEPNIPMQFFEDGENEAEITFIRMFPDAEICSIVLQSTVNLWGYAVIKNGQKIRARAGSSEDGTFVDLGQPLDEEKELLSKSTRDKNGKRTYLLDDFPNEPFDEDQVGENFVFSICQRYFEEELDSADDLLFETILTGYKYGKPSKAKSPAVENKKIDTARPWWKFW